MRSRRSCNPTTRSAARWTLRSIVAATVRPWKRPGYAGRMKMRKGGGCIASFLAPADDPVILSYRPLPRLAPPRAQREGVNGETRRLARLVSERARLHSSQGDTLRRARVMRSTVSALVTLLRARAEVASHPSW